MSPQFADFLKSVTADLLKSSGRNPPVCRFPQICHCRLTENLQAEIPPQFADFLKSATAHLLKIFRQKFPPQFADFLKSATAGFLKSAGRNFPPVCRFPQICHCKFTENLQAEISLQFADFLKSATADFLKSAGRNPPTLQIFSNLQSEIPPLCRFSQICRQKSS